MKKIWQGPYEILRHEAGDRYLWQLEHARRIIATDRWKMYIPTIEGNIVSFPCYFE